MRCVRGCHGDEHGIYHAPPCEGAKITLSAKETERAERLVRDWYRESGEWQTLVDMVASALVDRSLLIGLTDATTHLFARHRCECHGHKDFQRALDAAREAFCK